MGDLGLKIMQSRTIKPNSLRLYLTNLKKLNNDEKVKDLEFLKNKENILEKIEKFKLTTQRVYLTSVIVALQTEKEKYLDDLEFYQSKLKELNKQYEEFIAKNEKTESQAKNWVELKDLKKINNDYRKEIVSRNLLKRDKINNKEFDLIQKYLVSSLYTLQAPVRLNFAGMKIIREKSKDNDKDNFLYVKGRNNKFFIFNDFKTNKKMGKIEQKVNPQLNKIINLFLKFNKSNNFLLSKNGGPLTANALSKYITRTFKIKDKKITLNLIRHIYISDKIDIKKLKELEEQKAQLAESMHHGSDMQKDYAKI